MTGIEELIIIYIVVLVLATVLELLLTKKPSTPNLTPSALQAIPVATQGKSIPVVLGKRFIRQPNVVWWGDVESDPITMQAGGSS